MDKKDWNVLCWGKTLKEIWFFLSYEIIDGAYKFTKANIDLCLGNFTEIGFILTQETSFFLFIYVHLIFKHFSLCFLGQFYPELKFGSKKFKKKQDCLAN